MLKEMWKELCGYHEEITVLVLGSVAIKEFVVPLLVIFLGL